MAISLVGLQLIASLYKHGVLAHRRSVIEIGAQDLFPKQDDIANLLTSLMGYRWTSDIAITSELLYKTLGFELYECIDADGRHNALTFDLNKDLVQDYRCEERFDLVTNFGTTEHVFDQGRVFQSIHNLCAVKGLMIHEVPFQKRFSHGLYMYQPTFFYDLAGANRYDFLGMYLGLPVAGNLMPYSDDLAKILFRTGTDVELLAVLRKTADDRFQNPYNGKYLRTCVFANDYGRRDAGKPPDKRALIADRLTSSNATSDINQMPTRRIAKTLLRRMAKRFHSLSRSLP
jgi:hypothetical protein